MLNRRFLATSPHPAARAVREAVKAVNGFSLPAPKLVFGPLMAGIDAAREAYWFAARVLVCEPLFKASCKQYGKNLHTGSHLHYVTGKGDIIVGDDVTIGKINVSFGARYVDRPVLRIGSHSFIGHDVSFGIGKQVSIGAHCLIAARASILDVSGHPTAADARKAGLPVGEDEVRPVTLEDNVWVGRGAIIMPGVTIGEGSILASGAVVLTSVPPYSIVAGNPARKIGVVPQTSQPAPAPAPAAPAAAASAAPPQAQGT